MADNSSYPTHTPKCVFITGATGGFGSAFAHRFAALGCTLILHGRSDDKLDTLIKELDVPAHKVVFDICNKEQTIQALEGLGDMAKNIDVLVNNAGGALGLDKFQDADPNDIDNMIEMNTTSLTRITRAILPHMVENKRGHVINIGSIAGNWPYPGGHVYCAVKAFVKQFSLALRSDLLGTNVRVTNIEPGIAETGFSVARFKGDTDKAASVYANTTPLTADDIAESAVWAACLPEHVNINTMEVMPTKQSLSALHIERDG
jgi:3-hydroxy acid dehydrogenase/malonic semialdehyde reductase